MLEEVVFENVYGINEFNNASKSKRVFFLNFGYFISVRMLSFQENYYFLGTASLTGYPNERKTLKTIWGLFMPILMPIPIFDFRKSIRKSKTMVQWQVAMCAIAKSRLQIKRKPMKGSYVRANLIFLWQVITLNLQGRTRLKTG
ncbi:MAG: hypothetical protein J6C19_07645 [Lachnospiraceae bacterium]|nr:hypothetical protein [Lachnospiraceae bacterium]